MTRLRESKDSRVITLVAPAGYGKSTTLADWADQDPRPSIWLTLEDRHNDPALLCGAIATLLDQVETVPEDVFAPLVTPRSGVSDVVAPRLEDALRARKQPFTLVLDDVHCITNEDCVAVLAAIARGLPKGSQLAIGSRSEPPLPLGRLRANRELTELGVRQLAMSADESARLLDACGLRVSPESVELLAARTEGWPVALYLATLSIAESGQPDAAIADFHGDDRLVSDYVREEFLAGLEAHAREFLIKTSVLERLSGEACDAILESEGSVEVLRGLVRANRMIVPIDGRDRVYRHHALLREMLLAELRRLKPSVAAELHRRASAWHSRQGDIDRAVSHAIQSGDQGLAGALIWANIPLYTSSGRVATAKGWLAHFSVEERLAQPALCLSQATLSMTEGNGAEVELWAGRALEHAATNEPHALRIAAAARVIRASAAARDGLAQMRSDIESGLEYLAPDSPYRILCRLIEGVSHHLAGDLKAARPPLEQGAREGAATTPSVVTLCRSQLALLSLDEGDLDEAERQSQLARPQVDHYGLGDHPTQGLVFAVSALIRARRGRTDAAGADVKAAIRLESQLTEMSAWYEAEARITLARALILLDDAPTARTHLAAAGRYMRNLADATVLKDWIDSSWAEIEAADAVGGRWPLTPAELRLLHMLPTHFSFREIAEQIFVSPNTVKTQARSIYRKLGVASRAEAVACAQAAGLLSGEGRDSPDRGDVRRLDRA